MVLFHYFDRIECNKRDVTDMLMVAKHVIYRVRFRENIARRPTIRMLVLTCIIELQKLILSRMRMGEDVIGLNEIICQLRMDIGWD